VVNSIANVARRVTFAPKIGVNEISELLGAKFRRKKGLASPLARRSTKASIDDRFDDLHAYTLYCARAIQLVPAVRPIPAFRPSPTFMLRHANKAVRLSMARNVVDTRPERADSDAQHRNP
jgi:hypothetical protein